MRLADEFLEWWKSPDRNTAEVIFADNINFFAGSNQNIADIRLGANEGRVENCRLLKKVVSSNEAFFIVEATDEITLLCCRYGIFIKFCSLKIEEVIEVREVLHEN